MLDPRVQRKMRLSGYVPFSAGSTGYEQTSQQQTQRIEESAFLTTTSASSDKEVEKFDPTVSRRMALLDIKDAPPTDGTVLETAEQPAYDHQLQQHLLDRKKPQENNKLRYDDYDEEVVKSWMTVTSENEVGPKAEDGTREGEKMIR